MLLNSLDNVFKNFNRINRRDGKDINKMLTEKRLYIVFYCLFTLSRGKGDKVNY